MREETMEGRYKRRKDKEKGEGRNEEMLEGRRKERIEGRIKRGKD